MYIPCGKFSREADICRPVTEYISTSSAFQSKTPISSTAVSLTGKLLNYNGTPEMKWGQTEVLIPAIEAAVESTGILDWNDKDVDIYSVTGMHMSASRENLPQGVYILRSGEQIRKMIVR